MKKKYRYFLLTWILVVTSCKHYELPFAKEHGQVPEWMSFDVRTSDYYKGEIEHGVSSHIILHNINDSVQHIALFNENGAILITPDEMIDIDTNYRFIARFQKGNEVYYVGVGQTLQNRIDYFPMYYPFYDNFRVTLEDKASSRTIQNGDTVYHIRGTKTEKHCATDGTCRLVDKNVLYQYSSRRKAFIAARHRYAFRGKTISKITNINHDDQSELIDSVFNLSNERYAHYEHLAINKYYPYCTIYTQNTDINDTVLDFPLVNLASGDTTSLRQMQGYTLLYFYNFYLDHEWYSTVDSLGRIVADNIIWLMPLSNNTQRLKQLAREEQLGSNLYYTKGFTRHLIEDNQHQAYLIGPDHQTISIFDRIETFEEWIQRTHLKYQNSPL